MRQPGLPVVGCIGLVIGLALLCVGSPAAQEASNAPNDVEVRIEALAKTALSDPINSAARTDLAKRRAEQQQKRRQALEALVKALKAYADKQPELARDDLKTAMEDRYVVDLANSVLLVRLEEIASRCARRTDKVPTQCRLCYGSGWKMCRKCMGVGVTVCRQCYGRGTMPGPTGPGVFPPQRGQTVQGRVCDRCRGTGTFECPECGGRGFKKCDCAAAKAKPRADIGVNEREAIEKVIAIANYLRQGGIDYFSAHALECSPKLQP